MTKTIILALALLASAATASLANAPGGAYIAGDQNSSAAPVRQVPDGW
jgi:hypothetical protein